MNGLRLSSTVVTQVEVASENAALRPARSGRKLQAQRAKAASTARP